jgi:Ser/Thr protein kinase RdoA (MazF antagonist)
MVRTSVRNMTLRVFRLDDEAMQRFVLRVARPDEAVVNLDFVRRIYGDLQ